MKRKLKYYRLVWLKHDLPAGLSVFLVALPLCLGVALASGAPLYAGLLSGIIGGLVVALISGSSLAVSGPAAGLTTLVAASIASLGDYRIFLLTVVIAGFFQLLLGILKLGAIANYFPSAVIKGMLAAIGIILISKQVPLALGYEQPDFWRSGFLEIFSKEVFSGDFDFYRDHLTLAAVCITVLSLLAMLIFQRPYFKRFSYIPAALAAVLAGVIVHLIFTKIAGIYPLKQSQLVDIPLNIAESLTFPDFSKLFSTSLIWKNGLFIGLLATLETLLCIEAVDKLDKRNRITPVNRELVAQGIGNIACGLLGAIPITAVVVRGAANIQAGGRTKLSAFTHGIFLLIAVALIPMAINFIPYASLAAVLLVTGYNLTKPSLYVNMWRLGWAQFFPFLITIVIILATDLLIGVSIGLLISLYYIIQNNFRTEFRVTKSVIHGIDHYQVKLNTDVTFLNKVKLRKTLDEVPEYSVLTIDGSESDFIDYDILEIISEFESKARYKHIELHLQGIKKVELTSSLH
ncbi:SulP family inorganic anion transporter [Parapedobacter koreensis]|uniref:Carbonic anhydrase/sulfate permease, SulP family n=1 Tax=Parapedobacter koreensis TaxID=332977 RepID=A0A1H7JN24_9SPHI|nr:SulP family inorganic anion transporter [Parapedobacter koreensis]SEK75290.1 carbonic anhydrase/sulfate permease, SulP family [Parapedobacter koreensis]